MAANDQILTAADIGRMIPEKGIYLGTWEPQDRNGESLGKKLNVFVAPEDYTDKAGNNAFTFNEAAEEVASLGGWNGHDGGDFANDTALYAAFADGSGIGKWFIPTRELLSGRNLGGEKVHANNLFDLQNTGALKDTLTTTLGGPTTRDHSYPYWYWSSTEIRGHSEKWGTCFTDGHEDYDPTGTHRVSCRLFRVELALN
jgi:hypothetical protein